MQHIYNRILHFDAISNHNTEYFSFALSSIEQCDYLHIS